MCEFTTRAERGSIWSGLVVVLALIAALCVILILVAGSRQGVARRGWQQTLGSPEEVFARFPARSENDAALELERLAERLGIDIVPRSRRSERRPRPPVGDPRRERMGALRGWLDDAIRAPGPALAAPPAEVVAWLDTLAGPLDALRDALVDGESPEWERRLEELLGAPIPNLLGLIELNAVLVADGLHRAERGDDLLASRSLEAAWRLAESLIDEPEQIVDLVAISMARRVTGALRFVEAAPIEWVGRLESFDARAAVMRSMLISAWVWSQVDGTAVADSDDGVLVRALRSIAGPYMKMSMADMSERLRARLVELSRADPRCDADLAGLGLDLDIELPRWSIARVAYGPGVFGGVVERANRLELDLELTARLVELRAARAANGGRWPATLPGGTESTACPGDRWSYTVRSDGSMRFGLAREPRWRELPPRGRGVLPSFVVAD